MPEKTLSTDISILVVDDDAGTRETLSDILSEEGYRVMCVGTLLLAEEELEKNFYNIVLADVKLPDGTGLGLLTNIKKTTPDTLVIVLTGVASIENSIAALNQGAFAYLRKPINIDELKIDIKRAIETQKLTLDNRSLLNRLKELSLKDTHTELYNYRYLLERLTVELKRARRYSFTLSVIMLDIDYFKSINDVYGHQYGDFILKEFAEYLKSFVRGSDVVARYGGEEFVLILTDTSKEGATIFTRRLLEAVKRHIFDPDEKKVKLKISLGIASFPEDTTEAATPSFILDLADKALLNAKEMGGNTFSTAKDLTKDMREIVGKGGRHNVEALRIKLSKMAKRVDQTLLESIYAFAKTIEAKDHYTSEHAENMCTIVMEIGKRLKLSDNMITDLQHAAILHDLGKVGIPDDILHKNGKLTKEEYEIIKNHPQIGAEIIRPIHFLRALVPTILYHHERYDGLGYPAGLKGKEIPLGARIIAIADVYEALISDRPYRKAYGKDEAIAIVRNGAGTQFDPEISKIFLEIIESKKGESKKT